MSDEKLTIRRGARVHRTPPSGPVRTGLVIEVSVDRVVRNSRGLPWAEVMPEGSSSGRTEQWPLAELTLLPLEEQLPSLGGLFQPPKGYPLVTRRS
jgi:hypothetical protein